MVVDHLVLDDSSPGVDQEAEGDEQENVATIIKKAPGDNRNSPKVIVVINGHFEKLH